MARPPKGKPLTIRAIRLDDDVWAECQRLGKEHGTINEGLRERLFYITDKELQETRVNQVVLREPPAPPRSDRPNPAGSKESWKRGPRPKGDKTR